jgi:VWFA-related protein
MFPFRDSFRPGVLIPVLLIAGASIAGPSARSVQSQSQVPGAFRSRVTLVPVDVRVVDSRGQPITDLRQEDFTILEDGRPQVISHFAFQPLEAEPGAGGDSPAFRQPPGATLTPQRQRIFLIFLGRGRLQHPAMAVDGLIEFVRERLLPQDQVAVVAWNRATAFTTDHERILGVIERFKSGHEYIETWLSEVGRTLSSLHGTAEFPPNIQARVDAIFGHADVRSTLPDPLADTDLVTAEQRRTIGDLMRNDLISQRVGPEPTDAYEQARPSPLQGLGLDEYLQASSQSIYDLGNLYKAVAYLRYLEGEKHVVFVSQHGLLVPTLSGTSGIAAVAADARVAIHTVHTGGAPSYSSGPLVSSTAAREGQTLSSIVDETRMAGWAMANSPHFRVQTLRNISHYTGGIPWAYRRAGEGLARVDEATRSTYLLGYYPAADGWDGRFRRIEVSVNRRDARVLTRGGYFARDQIVTIDRREFLTYTRIAAAGAYTRDAPDIKVELVNVTVNQARTAATLTLKVDGARLSFSRVNGRHAATLDVAVFCGDDQQDIVGELWRKVELNLTDDTFARLGREGLSFEVVVPITKTPRHIKAVVYDYAADRVGSTTATLR